MQLHDVLNCCNYMELVGFNGADMKNDFDIFDDRIFNIRAGVLAVASQLQAWDEGSTQGLGSVFMTCAWDRYADTDPEVAHIQSWARGHGRKGRQYCGQLRRFIKYIHDNGLGKVHAIPDTTNPNHMSRIRTRIWHVNNKAVRKWAQGYVRPDERNCNIWGGDE